MTDIAHVSLEQMKGRYRTMRRPSFTAEFYAMDCYQVKRHDMHQSALTDHGWYSGTNCTKVKTKPSIRRRINAILLALCIRD